MRQNLKEGMNHTAGSLVEKQNIEAKKIKESKRQKNKSSDSSLIWNDLKEGILQNKKAGFLALGLTGLLSTCIGFAPLVSGYLSSYLQAQATLAFIELTTVAIGCVCMCPVLEGVINWVQGAMTKVSSYFQTGVSQYVSVKNSERFFKMPSLFRQRTSEKKLSAISDEMVQASSSIIGSSFKSLSSLIILATAGATLFVMSPLAGMGVLGLMMAKMGWNHFSNKRLMPLQDEIQKLSANNNAFQRDVNANIDNIHAMGRNQEQVVLNEMSQNNKAYRSRLKKLEFKREAYNFLNSSLDIIFSSIIGLAAFCSFQTHKDVGLFMALTGASYRSMFAGSNFVSAMKEISEKIQKYKGSKKLLEYDEHEQVKEAEKEISHARGRISLRDIDFSYSGEEAHNGVQLFNKLNLEIMPGEKVAVAGRSGSGKSTLLSILARNYEIQGGTYELDGQNVQEINRDSLSRNISAMICDSSFFETKSIKYNLRNYKPDASDEELVEALKKVKLDELLERKEGLESSVEQLSSGQKQRLRLACVCLSEAPIVILDEVTSRLDPETRKEVLETLDVVLEGKTAIYSSHSEGEIARADKVIVMDKGCIVEEGAPLELIQKENSQFHQLFGDYISVFECQARNKNASQKNDCHLLTSLLALDTVGRGVLAPDFNPLMVRQNKNDMQMQQYYQAQKQHSAYGE